jgi:predicted DNA-binding antitoxin AbrB/MazE fold protein
MKHVIDAIYENGIFRPMQPQAIGISEGKLVRITVEDETEPEFLKLATCVYDGLSDEEIDEIEQIALDRSNFFGTRSVD